MLVFQPEYRRFLVKIVDTKIRLNDHISTHQTIEVAKACKPLFENTPVTYFCFLRRYRDNSFTFLPTMSGFGDYLFGDGAYVNSWFAGLPFDDLKTGYLFWDLAHEVSCEEMFELGHTISNSFKLHSGIEMVEKHKDYCDFYSFSSPVKSIYFVGSPLLRQFIYHFKHKCQKLFRASLEDRLTLKLSEPLSIQNPIIASSCSIQDVEKQFDTKRYHLSGDFEHTFLTKRELEILTIVAQGGAIKCIADQLHTSPRTLEHHLSNMRDKLDLSYTSEVIHIARLQGLI